MSISDNYEPDISIGNGSTTIFSGTWSPIASTYMRVYKELISTGARTLQVLNTDYTLAFTSSGYTVTMAVAPSSSYNLIRSREVAIDQSTPYTTARGWQGATIENSFDKLTAITQDQQDAIDRSITFELGSSSTATLPEPEASKLLGWNAAGDDLQNYTALDVPAASVSAFALTLLDDTTAATARATLGSTTVGDAVFIAANAAAGRSALTAAASGANTDITSLAGTATNDSAAAGKIGELLSTVVLTGSAVSLTNTTPANITSVSLTAGDWDLSGTAIYKGGATTRLTYLNASFSAVSATADGTPGQLVKTFYALLTPFGVVDSMALPMPTKRISLASTTTYYLVTDQGFDTSTLSGFGEIRARRIR